MLIFLWDLEVREKQLLLDYLQSRLIGRMVHLWKFQIDSDIGNAIMEAVVWM